MTVLLDIYFLTTGLGFIYIVGSSLLGGLGSHGGHGGAGHGIGHGIGHGGAGHGIGHGIGHGGAGHGIGHGGAGHAVGQTGTGQTAGHTGGQASGHGNLSQSGTHGGTAQGAGHGNLGQSGTQSSTAPGAGHSNMGQAGSQGTAGSAVGQSAGSGVGDTSGLQAPAGPGSSPSAEVSSVMTQTGPVSSRDSEAPSLYLKLLDVLNPTKLALFTFLFGAIGAVSSKFLPGYLSLIPSIVGGWVLANMFFNIMEIILARMHSSTNFSKETLIGALGELTISMPPGSTGEVIISTGSSLYTSLAKASDPNLSIKKLAKVIVVDIKNGIFIVEPFEDQSLFTDTESIKE